MLKGTQVDKIIIIQIVPNQQLNSQIDKPHKIQGWYEKNIRFARKPIKP